MTFPATIWLLFTAALVISSIGFKNYVWFISLGYGFSIAGEGLLMLVLFRNDLSLGTALCCAAFVLYGCHLGGYLAYRELKSTSYSKNIKGEIKEGSTVPFCVKIAIWVTCALLYVLQVLPVFYRLSNGTGSSAWTYAGFAVMLCGVVLESAADFQKNQAKKINSRRFVDTGLYRIVRCPNYLGEMIFWTGVVISGVGGLIGVGQWGLALIGYPVLQSTCTSTASAAASVPAYTSSSPILVCSFAANAGFPSMSGLLPGKAGTLLLQTLYSLLFHLSRLLPSFPQGLPMPLTNIFRPSPTPAAEPLSPSRR